MKRAVALVAFALFLEGALVLTLAAPAAPADVASALAARAAPASTAARCSATPGRKC